MTRSKCSLAPLLLILSACSPACTSVPEAGAPENKGGPVAATTKAEPAPSDVTPPPGGEITEAKGVDLSRLSEPQKTSFFQLINSEPSACGKPHSLAVSLRDDAACRDSLSVSQFIADALASGASPSDIKANMEYVVGALQPRKIDIEGRPVYGNERAPVTVVVFADFECPHCRAEAPMLRQAIDQFRGRAKLVFKHFPLSAHPRAKVAAIATVAAQSQGKFWEMHDIVFENQTALSDADIRKYAQKVGLDMKQFDADFAALKGKDIVEADRAEGEKLEITGTPAVFVNGRYFNEYMFGGTVVGWIDDALRR
ncbi:DsbA family protein [Nannocystis pusilla]|uniref:DsbA family protein n=1 Tax=Nannocystis pusilla TaxID=889268 RepID=UPI003BF33D68